MNKNIFLIPLYFVLVNQIMQAQYGGGDGLTEQTAFEIHNITQLQYLADMVNNSSDLNYSMDKYFILMADIDDPVTFVIGNTGMHGTTDRKFMGKFDGNMKRINLAINSSSISVSPVVNTALFSRVSNRYFSWGPESATPVYIKNLIVYGYVENNHPGCAAGIAGDIIAEYQDIIISNCINLAKITNSCLTSGNPYTGGIIGIASVNLGTNTIEVSNCYNLGTIYGSGDPGNSWGSTGGIIGRIYDNVHLFNCVNAGFVWGQRNVGGIVGGGGGSNSLTNCVNTGVIEGAGYLGCITGSGNAVITNCWWDKQICPHDD